MFPRLLVALLLTLPPLWAVGPKTDEGALQAAARRAEELRRQGRLDEAVKEQQGALRLAEELYGADDPRTADQLDNLARLHQAAGQNARAESLLQRSLQIKEAKLGKDHAAVALALHNLAALYGHTGQYAKAELLYRRSLDLMEAKLGKDHPDVAAALDNLAALYRETGQHAQALPLLERSLEIQEARRGKDHPQVAIALDHLATLYQSMKEYAKAEPLYRRSLAIQEAELGKDHPTIAASLSILALLEGAQGQWQDSAGHAGEALRISRRYSVTVLPALSEPEQLAFLHERSSHRLHLALSLALAEPGLAAREAEWLLNGKGLPEAVLAERAWLARDAGDPERARAARELRDVRLRLARLTLADAPAGQPADRRRERDRLGEREAELARALGRRDGRDPGDDWLALDQLRKALPADTVLIDVARFDPFDFRARDKPWRPARYVAWVVPPAGRGDVRLVDLGEASKIDAAIGRVRESLGGRPRPSAPTANRGQRGTSADRHARWPSWC
jgi:tetratricopeptide (TPR) repeat protein